jgi:alkylation response protein AidB-like acyl-CoA dehydrogenase
VSTDGEMETVVDFRARAREWIHSNLREASLDELKWEQISAGEEEELAAVARDRELQRMFFDADLAGICIPREYGGQGLTFAHQHALNDEIAGFEFPTRFQVPTFSPCAAVLLEFGSEEQKTVHIPAMLKGEELWMQFLSEPSGGSDVAGALTTAIRDGDEWMLNGSKVWTTGAWWSDWGLCLARTNWDVPKHRGLTVFILPIHQPGVEVHRIEMLNGSREFCQEFITDVRIPDSDRVGPVDDGWTVATRWMFHERMLFNSPFVMAPSGLIRGGIDSTMVLRMAIEAGSDGDTYVKDLVGEARMLEIAGDCLQDRIAAGIRSGKMGDQSAAIARLFKGLVGQRLRHLAFEASGPFGGVWLEENGLASECADYFLMRQAGSIAGGTTEMARNVVSERVLAMPRERTLDRDRPFREVPRGPSDH